MYIENRNIKTKSNDTHFQSKIKKKLKILSIQVDMIKVLILNVELNINL